jgi:hypothetical protein
MGHTHRMARRAWCLVGVVLSMVACDDKSTNPEPQVERRALDVVYVIHPGRTTPGPVVLRCGFIVGPDSCWTLESVQARLDGYTVIVEGSAVRPAGAAECGSVARFDSIILTTPPLLQHTRYDLVAGALHDDLWIHPDYPPQGEWLMALGGICPPHISMQECYQFTPLYPGALAARGWLVENWPALSNCMSAQLYAQMDGRYVCYRLGDDNALIVRKVVRR